ncbi:MULTISPECIES: VOC family protein [Vibrio]|uniref:VOC family protein n=1 Tax=Vibrio TaxID=662 RepID=UPI00056DCF50|nr:VOC family protein [Vibrio pacinii]
MPNRNPIHVVALDHVVLRTTQLEAMIHFYQTILGCQVEREKQDIGLIQCRAGSALIDIVPLDGELGKMGGKAPQQDGRNVDHFCLQIEDFDEEELLDYLAKHQVKTSEFAKRYGAQGFGRSVYLEDPEGNVVELKPHVRFER